MSLRENCGIYGGFVEDDNISFEIYRGLFALQHRGQEAAGISVCKDGKIITHKGLGLVREVFGKEDLQNFKGKLGIGHVRYSTAGESATVMNAQPLMLEYLGQRVAIAHNGNIEDFTILRERLERDGTIMLTNSDTELIFHYLVREFKCPPGEWDPGKIAEFLFSTLKGAYSLLFLFTNKVVAIRDPKGYRPLWIYERNGMRLFSSEDSAFPEGGKRTEMENGSYAVITPENLRCEKITDDIKRQCIFEYVYFARPDSKIFGRSVHLVREKFGERCARENPVNADIVVPVMDSGLSAALGFSRYTRIPLEFGLIRNRWVGRTFIQPMDRDKGVANKLSAISDVVKDKRIVLVDDSIVRGTTSKRIVLLLRKAGAKEIHFRIASPPIKHECFWGVDIPIRGELIASSRDIAEYTGADSVRYLSLEGMLDVLGESESFCTHCFDGKR